MLPRSQEEAYFVLPLFPAPYSNGRKPDRGIPIPDRKREVVCYDRIHASPTIGREDGSFGYGFFEYFSDLHEFIRAAERETERVKAADGLCLGAGAGRTDLIYFSAVPWFAFTEMKHARSANRGDSIPRISTGKLTRSGDRLTMPVSLDVHHGFIDGRQAGEFFALLENRE